MPMKAITMREFAWLCRNDPELHQQVLAIPNTISPEKIQALARENEYQIVPEEGWAEPAGMQALNDDELDQISGGAGNPMSSQQLADWRVWLRIWTGIGVTS